MKEITSTQLLELPFGTKIKVLWHNSNHHKKNDEYVGVIFGKNIGYQDGLIDKTRDIAECSYNDWCKIFVLSEKE